MDNRKKTSHKCWSCRAGFPNHEALQNHMRTKHVDKPAVCRYCPKSFLLKVTLARHERQEHETLEYQSDSDQETKNAAYASPYACGVCHKAFARSSSLTNHVKSHVGIKSCACSVCGMSFALTGDLVNHLRQDHGIQLKSARNRGTVPKRA